MGQYLQLPKGIPSHDTFGLVFAALDPDEFRYCFISWTQSICQLLLGEVVPIDGKCLRRSQDKYQGKKAIHMVRHSRKNNSPKIFLHLPRFETQNNNLGECLTLFHPNFSISLAIKLSLLMNFGRF
ncbi:MAG: ISAs1 family transposase [Maribacter sp.]|nr:ISAs1 family transposase [Maribacter sp.]